LKKRITKKTVLAVLDLNKKIRIEVHASDYVIGNILFMKCKNKKWRLVAFLSKSLNKTKKNYKIHNKDILMVIRGLEN